MKIMAFSRLRVFILGAVFLLLLSATEAGEMGVNYGVVADNLPDTSSVVRLLKDNGITMVRIYDTDPAVLRSLANTGMKVVVMMPNEKVADAARDPSIAGDWVWNQVAVYLPATQINGVAVGNEVFDMRPDLTWVLVQAMKNVHAALKNLGLADSVKVTTPIAFSAVDVSFPPSDGRFRPDIAWSVMKPMLDFLDQTGSSLSMNFYPFFAFNDPANQINRDYAVGNPNNPGVQDPMTGLMYSSLLDAQRDATYYAMAKLGFSGSSKNSLGLPRGVPVKQSVPESGWPSRGQVKKGGRLGTRVGSDGGAATVANAQAYINNLINRVLSGNTGTPLHPDADMDVYIFALFNENKKGSGPDDIEQNFGLFYPNMTKVYEFDFHGGGASWCVANAAVGDQRLQAALDFACGNGADCSAIQPGATCFEPNTKLAHASFAVNSYYQNKGRAPGTCDFNGAAFVTFQEPDEICDPNASWCVANAAVGDQRLQTALDWACGHGADCGPIQPGAKCFDPNTKVAHASYAFNSYYQRNRRAPGTCDFAGTASVVFQAPKIGNCVLPWKSRRQETTPISDGSYAAL
ncbi:hypothetical protein QOZ80_7AG0570590 [Eleusine coracana subsp. coracana]|nr:hypothetical protein QOZ80_7AG0570590 [Eleusine coracana subsp. coracana]